MGEPSRKYAAANTASERPVTSATPPAPLSVRTMPKPFSLTPVTIAATMSRTSTALIAYTAGPVAIPVAPSQVYAAESVEEVSAPRSALPK